jgi:hypothetical protein
MKADRRGPPGWPDGERQRDGCYVRHPHLKQVAERLVVSMSAADRTSILPVVGTTGVGKAGRMTTSIVLDQGDASGVSRSTARALRCADAFGGRKVVAIS